MNRPEIEARFPVNFENKCFCFPYNNPNLPGGFFLHFSSADGQYFSWDLTNGQSTRSLAYFDFRIENGVGVADFYAPAGQLIRNNHINALFVDQGYRRKGVATSLIEASGMVLRRAGVDRIIFKGVLYTDSGFYAKLNPVWENIRFGVVQINQKKVEIMVADAVCGLSF